MFKRILFFISFFSIFHWSQAQNGKVDSTSKNYKVFYHPNGKVSSKGILIDGKPNGYWINYYDTGLLKSEGNRKNFELDSVWIFYNEFGDKQKSITYKNNLKNGLSKTYNDSCYLISKENYKNDIKEGWSYNYYPTKNKELIKSKTFFEKGKQSGKAYEYAEDGRIITIIEYKNGFISKKEQINRKDKNGRKQNIWKDFYPNERVKTEATYKNDLLNGYLKYYSSDGRLERADLYIDGVKQDESENELSFEILKNYYPNGKIKEEIVYNALGQKDGLYKLYDSVGEVKLSAIYENDNLLTEGGTMDAAGRKQGVWTEYYQDKTVKSKGKYLDGKKVEQWKYFFENGKAEQVGSYNTEGKVVGNWIWYFNNGDTLRYEEFRRGIEDGNLVEKTDSGLVITKGEYIDGLKEGEWIYELNDHIEKGNYRYGLKNGVWKHYDINGTKTFEGEFFEGQPKGKHKWWYANGKLKEEGKYAFGEKVGSWKKYNENGSLLITIQYKNGEEFKIDGKKIKIK